MAELSHSIRGAPCKVLFSSVHSAAPCHRRPCGALWVRRKASSPRSWMDWRAFKRGSQAGEWIQSRHVALLCLEPRKGFLHCWNGVIITPKGITVEETKALWRKAFLSRCWLVRRQANSREVLQLCCRQKILHASLQCHW